MTDIAPIKEEVITNYYNGKKFFLVAVDGNEIYVSEDKFKAMKISYKPFKKNNHF